MYHAGLLLHLNGRDRNDKSMSRFLLWRCQQMEERHRKLTLLCDLLATGLDVVPIRRTCREIRLRWYIPRDIATARAAHLKFNEVSDSPGLFGLPSGLTLWTPNRTKFICIAFAEIGTYLKENEQQRDDKNTYKTKDEKRHFYVCAERKTAS